MPSTRWSPFARLTALLLPLLMLGCAGGSEHTALPAAETRPVAGQVGNHIDTRLETLEKVLPWAVQDMHWGQMRVTNEVTALYASAVNDLDQIVEIRAQRVKPSGLEVQVKVGHFGDEKAEREFLRVLAERARKWDEKMGQKAGS